MQQLMQQLHQQKLVGGRSRARWWCHQRGGRGRGGSGGRGRGGLGGRERGGPGGRGRGGRKYAKIHVKKSNAPLVIPHLSGVENHYIILFIIV
ncbi:hypothetical protein ACFW04_013937 [Cataglyphis niger]